MRTFSKSRRHFLGGIGAAAAVLALPSCAHTGGAVAKKKRPNIVLIMADDMGYSDIGCYGGEIRTPNLDRLAADGLRFSQFYNTARCCPTRASLMTGLYPHQAGVGHMMSDLGHDGYRGDLNQNCATIAEVLGDSGYGTYMSGKWHVTKQVGHWSGDMKLVSKHNWPRQRGFDRFYGTIHGAGSFYDPVSLTRGNTPIEPETEAYYYTDAISTHASGFIEEHARNKPDDPFFCYVAYTAPHWPMHALPEDIAKYKGRYAAGWDVLREERFKRMVDMGLVEPEWGLSMRDPGVPRWEDAGHKRWHRAVMEVYAAMIDRMDQGIGKIVATLKETGQLQNTIIFFIADNGGCAEGGTSFKPRNSSPAALHTPELTRDGRKVNYGDFDNVMPGPEETYQQYGRPWANASNTPFRMFKHWVHEGGIASPLVVHWPEGLRHRGEWRDQPGHLIDIMATCVDVSGADYPETRKGNKIHPMEGKSLVPAFANKRIEREALYWEHEGNRAIRAGKWKLVAKGSKGEWELYDLKADRSESNNVVKRHPARAQKLADMWEAYARRAFVYPLRGQG